MKKTAIKSLPETTSLPDMPHVAMQYQSVMNAAFDLQAQPIPDEKNALLKLVSQLSIEAGVLTRDEIDYLVRIWKTVLKPDARPKRKARMPIEVYWDSAKRYYSAMCIAQTLVDNPSHAYDKVVYAKSVYLYANHTLSFVPRILKQFEETRKNKLTPQSDGNIWAFTLHYSFLKMGSLLNIAAYHLQRHEAMDVFRSLLNTCFIIISMTASLDYYGRPIHINDNPEESIIDNFSLLDDQKARLIAAIARMRSLLIALKALYVHKFSKCEQADFVEELAFLVTFCRVIKNNRNFPSKLFLVNVIIDFADILCYSPSSANYALKFYQIASDVLRASISQHTIFLEKLKKDSSDRLVLWEKHQCGILGITDMVTGWEEASKKVKPIWNISYFLSSNKLAINHDHLCQAMCSQILYFMLKIEEVIEGTVEYAVIEDFDRWIDQFSLEGLRYHQLLLRCFALYHEQDFEKIRQILFKTKKHAWQSQDKVLYSISMALESSLLDKLNIEGRIKIIQDQRDAFSRHIASSKAKNHKKSNSSKRVKSRHKAQSAQIVNKTPVITDDPGIRADALLEKPYDANAVQTLIAELNRLISTENIPSSGLINLIKLYQFQAAFYRSNRHYFLMQDRWSHALDCILQLSILEHDHEQSFLPQPVLVSLYQDIASFRAGLNLLREQGQFHEKKVSSLEEISVEFLQKLATWIPNSDKISAKNNDKLELAYLGFSCHAFNFSLSQYELIVTSSSLDEAAFHQKIYAMIGQYEVYTKQAKRDNVLIKAQKKKFDKLKACSLFYAKALAIAKEMRILVCDYYQVQKIENLLDEPATDAAVYQLALNIVTVFATAKRDFDAFYLQMNKRYEAIQGRLSLLTVGKLNAKIEGRYGVGSVKKVNPKTLEMQEKRRARKVQRMIIETLENSHLEKMTQAEILNRDSSLVIFERLRGVTQIIIPPTSGEKTPLQIHWLKIEKNYLSLKQKYIEKMIALDDFQSSKYKLYTVLYYAKKQRWHLLVMFLYQVLVEIYLHQGLFYVKQELSHARAMSAYQTALQMTGEGIEYYGCDVMNDVTPQDDATVAQMNHSFQDLIVLGQDVSRAVFELNQTPVLTAYASRFTRSYSSIDLQEEVRKHEKAELRLACKKRF